MSDAGDGFYCWTAENLNRFHGIRLLEALQDKFGKELVVFLSRASYFYAKDLWEHVSGECETEAGNESAVWVNQLNITSTADAEDGEIAVTLSEQPSADTPENDRNETTFRYVNVETTYLPNAETTPGPFTYRIPQQRFNESGIEPAEINMFQYHDGTWDSIDESDMSDSRLSSDTPGFSWFAISGPVPNMSTTAATLNTSTVSTGGTAALNLTVENTGTLAGNTTLNVTADGELVDSRAVTVSANESVIDAVTLTFDSSGTREIAVNSNAVGTVTVTTAPESTVTLPTEAPSTESTPTTLSTELFSAVSSAEDALDESKHVPDNYSHAIYRYQLIILM